MPPLSSASWTVPEAVRGERGMANRKGTIARRKGAPGGARTRKGGRGARAHAAATRASPARTSPARTSPARAASKRLLRAGDLMSRNPITVQEDMTVADLCDLFQEKNINGAPVVDNRGRLVGEVAQDDIIYGAMGHPGAAAPPPEEPPAEPEGAPGAGSPARRRSRRVVAMLRERHLASVPEAAPRPGER